MPNKWLVLITRAKHQTAELSAALSKIANLERVCAPLLAQVAYPLEVDLAQDQLIRERLESGFYAGIIFSSANGVEFFSRRLLGLRFCEKLKLIAQGETTAAAIKQAAQWSHKESAQPVVFLGVAEQLVAGATRIFKPGDRVLWPSALFGRHVIESGLQTCGVQVEKLIVYQTRFLKPQAAPVARLAAARPSRRVLTFFSPSAVNSFLAGWPEAMSLLGASVVVAVGSITGQRIREACPGVSIRVCESPGSAAVAAEVASLIEGAQGS